MWDGGSQLQGPPGPHPTAEHPSPANTGQGHPALSLAAPRHINRRRDVKEVNEQGILHNLILLVLYGCVLCPGCTGLSEPGTFLHRSGFIPCAPVFGTYWISETSLILGSSQWKCWPLLRPMESRGCLAQSSPNPNATTTATTIQLHPMEEAAHPLLCHPKPAPLCPGRLSHFSTVPDQQHFFLSLLSLLFSRLETNSLLV